MNYSREILVCKDFTFDSAHNLSNYDGKCNHLHGHTYRLQVGVKGIRSHAPNTQGLVIDFGKLKSLVNAEVVDVLDHKELNAVMGKIDPEYNSLDVNTTCENMIDTIWDMLAGPISVITKGDARLEVLRLWETTGSYAELDRATVMRGYEE